MKPHYDPDADALYLRFAPADVVESEEVRPGLVLDYDSDGRIVAIELLNASKQASGGAKELQGLVA